MADESVLASQENSPEQESPEAVSAEVHAPEGNVETSLNPDASVAGEHGDHVEIIVVDEALHEGQPESSAEANAQDTQAHKAAAGE